MAAVVARENFHAHNHLAGLSVIKPGLLRRIALKAIFAAIAQLATHLFRPGWLGTLGTIHFARWVRVPGTRDLIFLSNYGGSFESYLEDFITKAHIGLTGSLVEHRGISTRVEPGSARRERRRFLQAMGAPAAGSHWLLVLGVSAVDHHQHPHQRGDPPGTGRRS